jgi:hypothetical protein
MNADQGIDRRIEKGIPYTALLDEELRIDTPNITDTLDSG